ncbi:hypothetical protein [Elstera cyanobacteriorum]|uniref:hypothetical protein n=1 Tax=Elstera cyanobacteriorum TaxID=2022747 RepID=UPI002357F688|nr:hypothetical protein [Elstera cyanobacteriorum]MCK6442290.1 hypothetical protein [Elstera cyanobacteriorum]
MAEESQEKSAKPDAVPTGFGRTEWVTVSAVIAVFIFTYVVAAWLPEWVRAIFNVTDAGGEGGGRFGVFGPIGDFFGGILNPILTFFTVCLLLQSLKLQRLELAATRAELARTAKANEELASLQRLQVERSIQSANALTDAAIAQMDTALKQEEIAKLQKLSLVLEARSLELREINIQINECNDRLSIFEKYPNLVHADTHKDRYFIDKDELIDLMERREQLENSIRDIGNRISIERAFGI